MVGMTKYILSSMLKAVDEKPALWYLFWKSLSWVLLWICIDWTIFYHLILMLFCKLFMLVISVTSSLAMWSHLGILSIVLSKKLWKTSCNFIDSAEIFPYFAALSCHKKVNLYIIVKFDAFSIFYERTESYKLQTLEGSCNLVKSPLLVSSEFLLLTKILPWYMNKINDLWSALPVRLVATISHQ